MRESRIRKARRDDFDEIYLMGEDVWAAGADREEYLDDCRNSLKYRQGIWWVLENTTRLLSSLVCYDLGNSWVGIGSIATPKELRKKGYASRLLSLMAAELEENSNAKAIFLFADIAPNQNAKPISIPKKKAMNMERRLPFFFFRSISS